MSDDPAQQCLQLLAQAYMVKSTGPYLIAWTAADRQWREQVPHDKQGEWPRGSQLVITLEQARGQCVKSMRFMDRWEPAHWHLLNITQVDWDQRLDAYERLAAELQLQAELWVPWDYVERMYETHFPKLAYAKAQTRMRSMLLRDKNLPLPRTHDRYIGMSFKRAKDAWQLTRFLRRKGFIMPDLPLRPKRVDTKKRGLV